ncbi:putative transcription factor, partial [Mucuna pruriens]
MAQKQKLRPSPLDEPPTASSSESEEEDHQQPSSQQHEEEEEEEVVSSEEEEEASSQEEDEDDDLPPPIKNPPAPPTTPNPQSSSSDSDTESGSETESEPDPTPSKVKPLASKPMDPPQKPKVQPSPAPVKSIPKRPLDNNAHHVSDSNPKRPKKKATDSFSPAAAAPSDEDMEEDAKKSGDHLKRFQRLWSEDDEIAILKGMVEFTSKTGQDPLKFTNANAFHDFMKKSLHAECSSNQLKEKVRRLKKKFETNAGKVKNGEGPSFAKLHDQRSFELSKKVWGNEQGGAANGPVEKPKANGNAAKSPKKKETVARNVASAKKLKPEAKPDTKPESAPVASLELKESGRMEIDQKPDSGVGASLLWRQMSRYKEGVSGYQLNDDEVKRGLELIGESKRAELEEKWKKLQLAEMELFANRSLLIGEQTRDIVFTRALFVGSEWMRSQGSDANVTRIDLIYISNAAIDYNPGPAIVMCYLCQIPSQQRTPQASTSINNQHSSFSFRL